MTTSRSRSLKGRTVLYGVGIFLILSVIYLYQSNQEEFHQLKRSKQKCLIEQESLSSQLQVVTDFKVRIEKSLTQERSEHAKDLAAVRNNQQEERDTLQQSVSLLQSQFDDLTLDCNKVRDSGKGDRETLKKYKSMYNDIKSSKDGLQYQYDYKSQEYSQLKLELDKLKQENLLLNKNIELLSKTLPVTSFFFPEIKKNTNNFSKQIEVADGVYVLNVGSNNQSNEDLFKKYSEVIQHQNKGKLDANSSPNSLGVLNYVVSSSVANLTKVVPKPSSTTGSVIREIVRPEIPGGVPPELRVDDNIHGENKNLKTNIKYDMRVHHNEEVGNRENFEIGHPPERYDTKLLRANNFEENNVPDNEKNNLLLPPLAQKKDNGDILAHRNFLGGKNNGVEMERSNDDNDFNDNNSFDNLDPALQNGHEVDDDDGEDFAGNRENFQAVENKN